MNLVPHYMAENHAMALLQAMGGHLTNHLADSFFPETGPFARHLYPKHMEFIAKTGLWPVVTMFGGNRVGKTMLLAWIDAIFLRGVYPEWWPGRRFQKPIKMWIAGQTSDLVIASKQKYLIGSDGQGGLIPKDDILNVEWESKSGLARRILVRNHNTGMVSEANLKTYDMGWKRFQSDTIDVADLDESPNPKIFSECVTRTATTDGLVMLGMTGLDGIDALVAHLWPELAGAEPEEEDKAHRGRVVVGWDDIPYTHPGMSKERRKALELQYMPHERSARIKGIPTMGQGMVYPVAESEFVVEPFEIPAKWPRAFACDPGGTPGGDGKTAALWCAWDPDSDTIYAYSEHYQEFAELPVHVHAFAKRGSWIPCILDPAGANIIDGKGVKSEYTKALQVVNKDWPVYNADKRFSLGRMELYGRLTGGGFKVFNSLRNFLGEHRQYVVDEFGKFKGPHHLLDCARYVSRGTQHFIVQPKDTSQPKIKPQTFF